MTTYDDTKTAAAPADAIEVHGMTREAFLLRGALATGALYGMGMVSPFIRRAAAQEMMDDVGILNFALTLELLEADFYRQGLQKAKLSGEAKEFATSFGEHEQAHVDALTSTIQDLGGTPVDKPTFAFPFNNQQSFLKLAQTLEDTGVSAYNGAAPMIKNKDVLAAAGSIVQIEARHAAVIRQLLNMPAAPNAFDPALTTDKVLAAVKPFIKG